ncbi:MAG: guanylyltransferase [Polyangiaceae bacterium]|jgi:tRNA(His) 5'-end guanylyltransferase|nr:guanylyltransferase [Polyangiaceae bacterium]
MTTRRPSSFEQLDRRMRVYETAHDHCVLPGVHIVARIDGRSFSQLTRGTLGLREPYDARMRAAMEATLTHLMVRCGFSTLYGYTQSDELSVLLRRDEAAFGRKERKIVSVLAGEASACFSLAMGVHGAFDARVCQLPRDEDVVDYFRWRQEDAHRNALNGHCYWLLRGQGMTDDEATRRLSGASISQRNELLFQHGVNFNDLPAWQRRGVGARWEHRETRGVDPRSGAPVIGSHRELILDASLPMRDEYDAMVATLVRAQ